MFCEVSCEWDRWDALSALSALYKSYKLTYREDNELFNFVTVKTQAK